MLRLAIRVAKADAEIALAELLALVPAGVEERDLGDAMEYAVYGAPGELPSLPDLRAAAGPALVEVRTEEVADDWDERWKAFHRPVEIDGRLCVRAPWHPAPATGLVDVVIDPAQAFGTGAHDTTRMCLELLLGLAPGGPLVDLGCGSGVLAIAAAKLGWEPVLGLDNDPASVAATFDNARANGVEVRAERFDLLRSGSIPSAPTVVANLLRPLLLRVAKVGFREAPPSALIVSGLLRDQTAEVEDALAPLRAARRRDSGDWAALLLVP